MKFKLSVTGDLRSKLEERISKWRGQVASATVHVPDDLKWWVYQEYGTATYIGGSSYSIDPVNADALSFPGPNGEKIFAKHVNHPGIPPRHPVQKAMPAITRTCQEHVSQAFREGAADDPALLQTAVSLAVLQAKEEIVTSLAENIPGTRIDGKLLGQSASSVFDEQATVVEGDQIA